LILIRGLTFKKNIPNHHFIGDSDDSLCILKFYRTAINFIRLKLVFLFVSLSTFTTYAQITLKGTILDERSKKSVFGASVKLKGQLGETFTDVDGAFQLKVKALPATLLVKSIGYKPQEFDIYEAEPITIYLNEDLNELDNVVVTGYVQTKRNAKTSAISEIKADPT
jgi:hypothetical protein